MPNQLNSARWGKIRLLCVHTLTRRSDHPASPNQFTLCGPLATVMHNLRPNPVRCYCIDMIDARWWLLGTQSSFPRNFLDLIHSFNASQHPWVVS